MNLVVNFVTIIGVIIGLVAIVITYRIYHNSRVINIHIVFINHCTLFIMYGNLVENRLILYAIDSQTLEVKIILFIHFDYKIYPGGTLAWNNKKNNKIY